MRSKNPLKLILLLSLLFSTTSTTIALAADAKEKGLEIAREADRRDSGWNDATAEMQMVLINPNGQKSVRDVRLKFLEVAGDGDKSLSVFDSPKDVQGTAFLSFSHALVPDEQWLYLPALKRVKRIASANKSGPFMGSEFAFEDLSSTELDKYAYEYLREEQIDGQDCYVIRNFPQYEHSGYQYRDVWIDKQHYRTLKIDFYDRKGALLKTLTQTNHRLYLDKYWRAEQFNMVNHQTHKATDLIWKNYQFQTGLSDADFNRNSLMRIR